MNPDKVKTRKKSVCKKTQRTVKKSVSRKGHTKTYSGNSTPLKVYALRSSEEQDDTGVWVKVFMCYNGDTVQVLEFENGIFGNTLNFDYIEARTCWQNWVQDDGMNRDDSYIKGLPLGDVRI